MKKIWVPVSAQIAQSRKIDTIANNIANANTNGYKRDDVVFKEHLTALTQPAQTTDLPRKDWKPKDFYHSHGGENAFVKTEGSYTSFTQGNLSPSGNPLDIAIKGPGFIKVMTPQGLKLTRESSFSLNENGEIVTNQGHKVLDSKTDPENLNEAKVLTIPGNTKFISINENGEVYTDKGLAGIINLVELNDTHALKKEGSNTFYNPYPDNEKAVEKTTVMQGFVEQSNVNAVHEMSQLIKAHRHFDNIQKTIKTYDDITGRAVNDIANF